MMPCVYCIGCRWYKKDEKVYCSHPDRDRCNQREYWEGDSDET